MKYFSIKDQNLNGNEIIKVLFSLLARVWNMMLVIILTPIYIKYLGTEAYGLIGFFILVQSILMILEFGLPLALNRTIARHRAKENHSEEISYILKSFEYLFFALSLIIIIFIAIPASFFHDIFINSEILTSSDIAICIFLIFTQVALRFPIIIYQAALTGFEKIIELNIIMISFSSARLIGSGICIVFFHFDIVLFFTFQIIVVIFELLYTRIFCWNKNKLIKNISYRFRYFYNEIDFVSTAFFISLIGILSSQLDKLIIVSNLTLELFGEYSLMVLFGTAIIALGNPIGSVSFPSFSRENANLLNGSLLVEVKKYMPISVLIIVPISSFIIFFIEDILRFYIENSISIEVINIFPIYIIGSMFAGFIPLFNGLVLSSNSSKDSLYILLISSVIYLACLPFLISFMGIFGAAYGYCFLQILIFSSYVIRSCFLPQLENLFYQFIKLVLIPALLIFLLTYIANNLYEEYLRTQSSYDMFYLVLIYFLVQAMASIPFLSKFLVKH